MKRKLFKTCPYWLLPCFLLGQVLPGCARPYHIPFKYYSGQYDFLIENESKKAERAPRDRALHYLHVASAALAAGRSEDAHDAFAAACELMLDFDPNGEWKAVYVEERAKDFRGDPYETLVAYLMLGMLEYASADLEDAQASFKTALLADTGSSDERYRSDSVLSWLLAGKALQRLGDAAEADEYYRRAKYVPWFRWSVKTVGEAINIAGQQLIIDRHIKAKHKQLQKELGVACRLLLDGISAAASEHKTPKEVMRATRHTALDRLWSIAQSANKRDADVLRGLEPSRVAAWIEEACDAAYYGHIAEHDTPEARQARQNAEALVDLMGDEGNNILVIAYMGPGPTKYAIGKYGHILKYYPNHIPIEKCLMHLAGGTTRLPLEAQNLEDVRFQATTRGGREMDAILKNKVVFRDAMISTGTVTLVAASAVLAGAVASMYAAAATATTVTTTTVTATTATTTTTTVATASVAFPPAAAAVIGGLLIAAGASYAIARATNPAADTRHWETIPGVFYVASGKVSPGLYSLEVECQHPPDTSLALMDLRPFNPRKIKPEKGDSLANYANMRYGATAPRIEIKPGFETVVLINAGPFSESFDGNSTPVIGHVPILSETSGLLGFGKD